MMAATTVTGYSQGLTAVRNFSGDFTEDQPLTWSITTRGGYDNLKYDVPSAFLPDFESWYIQGGVGMTYTEADPVTPWSMDLDLGATHYLDDMPRYDDTFYNARVAFNLAHKLSERLKISNNFYLTYEAEPNLAFGGSTTLFNGQYLYGYNNFNVSYAWSQRFSTTTSYTVDGITYDDNLVSSFEDRLSHLVAQQFSYAISQRTTLNAEYRYRHTQFRAAGRPDFQSHFALAGLDHAWSERTTGSFRAGAEFFRSYGGWKSAPYGEIALSHQVARKTTARWFGVAGYDGAELGAYDSRYALRTGVNFHHQVTKRFGVQAGASYAYSEFDGDGAITDVTEHSLLLSTGLSYQILENLSLDTRYSYSLLDSDDAFRSFDRHNVSVGVTASF
ncbi:MAG TPA: outer membrane beta-barrel protein [Prosthecobacter sp.]|nr:outer membrane beta-barrel protein [Prosthecobacter sp.]